MAADIFYLFNFYITWFVKPWQRNHFDQYNQKIIREVNCGGKGVRYADVH